ncbi:ribokinase-like [Diorhabda sublineata]|uniref:ribokinase-like n=1 Tax=Diorhabda sublineata TaxID=1163346 RepID=UPI0024E0D09C|nr:ribokinase-like [Diorhabda sublineata]
MSSNDIVVVGSCMIDFVSYAARLPKSGETIHGKEFATNFGGKGANQCVAAAKLGGDAALVARVGDDVWGPKYIDNLNKLRINTDFVRITEGVSTGVAQITVSDSGENQIIIVAGANHCLTAADVELAQDIITKAAVLVLQLETSQDVAIRAIQLCRGISILNGAPALADFNPQLLKLPTIFCVNETEASVFTGGLPVNNICEAQNAASALIKKGCNSVIITLGSRGAIYADNKEKFHICSPTVKSVDTTGAGDAFIGALAFLLATETNISMRRAVEKACLAASDSVTRPGTQISFPGPSILQ